MQNEKKELYKQKQIRKNSAKALREKVAKIKKWGEDNIRNDHMTIGKDIVFFDPEDRDLLVGTIWYVKEGRCHGSICGEQVSLSRYLMGFNSKIRTEQKIEVHHIDNNPLNNRKDNLMLVTRSENCLARRKKGSLTGEKSPFSKYKGVFQSNNKTTLASIKIGDKQVTKTVYDELLGAYIYDEAALILHGKFSVTNRQLFPTVFNDKKLKELKTKYNEFVKKYPERDIIKFANESKKKKD